jgi:hypothetical protein
MTKIWMLVFTLAVAFGILIWAADRVTWQGERTIYTVACDGGAWDGMRCAGRLKAGELHRFRSSRSRNEVLYWVAGSSQPSGKYTGCQVKDRDNWTCTAAPDQPPSIAHQLAHGKPMPTAAGLALPYRAIAKWKWWVLQMGIPAFAEADFGSNTPPVR